MNELKLEKFLFPYDPRLRQISEDIRYEDIRSPHTNQSIVEMLEVAYGEREDRNAPMLVGLAAPQIGIMKRIIMVDLKSVGTGPLGALQTMINPYILFASDEQEEWYEGCFSTSRVCGIVSRSRNIRVKYFDREGVTHEEDYSGYTARIIQHEIDHLNGQTFVSRITDGDKLHWVEKRRFVDYRDNGRWRNWPHKCSWQRWLEIQNPPPVEQEA